MCKIGKKVGFKKYFREICSAKRNIISETFNIKLWQIDICWVLT